MDRLTGWPDWVFECKGCNKVNILDIGSQMVGSDYSQWTDAQWDAEHANIENLQDLQVRRYLAGGFLEHFRWCDSAQRLWKKYQKVRAKEAKRKQAEMKMAEMKKAEVKEVQVHDQGEDGIYDLGAFTTLLHYSSF